MGATTHGVRILTASNACTRTIPNGYGYLYCLSCVAFGDAHISPVLPCAAAPLVRRRAVQICCKRSIATATTRSCSRQLAACASGASARGGPRISAGMPNRSRGVILSARLFSTTAPALACALISSHFPGIPRPITQRRLTRPPDDTQPRTLLPEVRVYSCVSSARGTWV